MDVPAHFRLDAILSMKKLLGFMEENLELFEVTKAQLNLQLSHLTKVA
jgi:hypothetical protein